MALSKFDKIVHTNWGYWDGVADAKVGRYPVWAKCYRTREKHPCDKHYGEGYWIGYYGELAPPYALTGTK